MRPINVPLYFLLAAFLLFFSKKTTAQIPELIITEIMYNPPEVGTDSLEYLEIYNNGNTELNLAGINFSQGVNYTFPNLILPPNQYFILAKDSIVFQNTFGSQAYQWETGTLSNNGETIELITNQGETIDIITYENEAPWPEEANGLGASLVLCNLNNNDLPENWSAATSPTDIFIGDQEIIANPNAESECPTGPIISFLENEIFISEENITINLQIAIENGNTNATEVELHLNNSSTAIFNEDFIITNMPPIVIDFPAGSAKDTQSISIQIIEDLEIEPNEILIFELLNPTNEAIINPMHHVLELTIEDDDATLPDLVISEIMYNPPEVGMDSTEYIELYNNDTLSVNLVGYYFSKGIDFTFPEYILNPGEYIVISNDSVAFFNYYGFYPWQWTSGSLTNSGEIIELRNLGGNVADVVQYDNISIWSLLSDGNGSSLVVCDLNEDNNDPTNWSSSISSTGIIIDGKEITADPGMENNCFIPLSAYPNRTIGEMTSVNAEGIADSLNQKCALVGIVHSVNFNASNDGLQFVLMDENNDGITVFRNSINYNYEVEEGDQILVQGTISQFFGLTEIIPDTLWMISNNNILTTPIETTSLNESTESKLITIKNLTILNPSDWNSNDPNGFTVEVTNGVQNFDMRIDQDVDLFEMEVPDFSFNLTGIGNQYDLNIPFLEGYQIMPRYSEDLEMITGISQMDKRSKIKIYPNPIQDFIKIEMDHPSDKIIIRNIMGQRVFETSGSTPPIEIDCRQWSKGVYWLSVFSKNNVHQFKLLKVNSNK